MSTPPAPKSPPGKAQRFYRYFRGTGPKSILLGAEVVSVQDGRLLKRETAFPLDTPAITMGKVQDALSAEIGA
jgi:hypothetical protein